MSVLWSLNSNGHSYDLAIDNNDKWVIRQDNLKVVLRYNEETKKWMGIKNGKIVSIDWPTFRDIVNKYLVQ